MDDVSVDPTSGLPNLLTVLSLAEEDPSRQESVKRNVPRIFEMLPQAMESLSEKNPKPVFAASAVIGHCVKVHNEPAAGGTQLAIEVEDLKQCQQSLVALLRKAQEKAAQSFWESDTENDKASKEIVAIALATVALFKLEEYATECKQEFKNSGGIVVALKVMDTETSGIKWEAKQALAWVLALFVESQRGHNVDNIETILESRGNLLLARYVENASKYAVPRDMQAHCRTVLEACLRYGKEVTNADDIQRALANGRT